MEVRIRRASETGSYLLADVGLLDVDKVIPTLKSAGGLAEDDAERPLNGQVVFPDGATPYYEVVIDDFTGG